MRRFFTTFFLLAVVASSLVISNSFFKANGVQYSSHKSDGIQTSVDLTEVDLYQSKRNTVYVTMPN